MRQEESETAYMYHEVERFLLESKAPFFWRAKLRGHFTFLGRYCMRIAVLYIFS